MNTAEIIKLVLILAAAVVVTYLVVRIVKAVQRTAKKAGALINSIQKVTDETATTPRTISGMEPVIIQRVARDFPDFNIEVGREMVRTALTCYFAALNGKTDAAAIENVCTHALIDEIMGLSSSNSTSYDKMRIHKIAASNYAKNRDNAQITFQAAIEYQRDNKGLMQYVYEVQLAYYFSQDNEGAVAAARCSYCGGDLEEKGGKLYCRYCGSVIENKLSEERWWRVNGIVKAR